MKQIRAANRATAAEEAIDMAAEEKFGYEPEVDAGRGEGLSLGDILSPKSADMSAIKMSSEAVAAEAAAAEEDAERDMSAEAIDMAAEDKFGYEQRIARAGLLKEIILFTQQQEVWN